MLRSAWIVIAAVLLLTSFGVCQTQGHFDASFNSALIFTRSSDANAVQQSATIGANYFGTFRLRLNKKSKNSLIFNFGYAKNSQVYQTNFNYHQLDTIHEYTAAYVRNFYEKGKFQPFFLVGAGAMDFYPRSTWVFFPNIQPNNIPNNIQVNVNAQSQWEAAILYGGGVDYSLPWKFALRLQYRGLIYNNPNFNVNNLNGSAISFVSGYRGHMAEPSIGLVFRF
jgi:opacity protein-like surface antigen